MKEYYKQLDENGEVIMLFTYDYKATINDPLVVQITAEEYETIKSEWAARAANETALKA
jgi:hypothetical protein